LYFCLFKASNDENMLWLLTGRLEQAAEPAFDHRIQPFAVCADYFEVMHSFAWQ